VHIRFLGTHNEESINTRLVSFLIDEILAVDAGSLASELTFSEQSAIKAILLTHGHYDHIRGVPSLIFNNRSEITEVFATSKTLQILSSHLVDGVIYPMFTDNNSFLGKAALELIPLEPLKPELIQGYRVLAVPVKHPINAVGFEIMAGDGKTIFYTGDTGPGLSEIWQYISPQLLVVDVSFPNSLRKIANDAGHLCPELLKIELTEFQQIKGYLPQVIVIHLNPRFESEIGEEVEAIAKELQGSISIATEGDQVII
jgi:ribonuclease BN (tRNA processing enzyme)